MDERPLTGVGRFGVSLPNRAVTFGAATVADLLAAAELAEAIGVYHAVWVGDSLLAKPRLDAIVLLSAVATRTLHVRLGPACMASFPLRHPLVLAYQWASLDLLSEGRTIMVACIGGGARDGAGDFETEFAAMGIPREDR
jgi:alkanesulfonate monooxygenase SsuD/methylene tetrahydromethanopterin reductase-like flavin-dependent oxidoreductase (luciferase family)